MGNRALRRQLGKLVGTFYTGPKFAAFSRLPAWRLRRLIAAATINPGDIIHDCDGFNHRVKNLEPEWRSTGRWEEGPGGVYMNNIDIEFEGGDHRCQCTVPESARPISDIRAWWKNWIEYQRANGTGWGDGAYCDELLRRINSGEPITDADGCRLPELNELRIKTGGLG